ncbi:hypothetical protein [Amycolatopsis sp. A1MSW2902]
MSLRIVLSTNPADARASTNPASNVRLEVGEVLRSFRRTQIT